MLKSFSICAALLLAAVLPSQIASLCGPAPVPEEADEETLVSDAYELYYSGDYEGALVNLDACLRINADNVPALNLRSALYANWGQWDESLADCARVIELWPEDARCWNTRGTILRQQGNFEAAIKDFEEAMELRPKWVWPVHNKAECLAYMGKEQEALPMFDKALKMEPDYMPAKRMRYVCLRVLGDYDQSATEAKAMLKEDPKAYGAHYAIGEQQRKAGKFKEAQASYDKEIENAPDNYAALVARADVHVKLGNRPAALRDLADAQDLLTEISLNSEWHAWLPIDLACLYSVRSTAYADDDEGKQSAKDDLERVFRLLKSGLRKGFGSLELLGHDVDLEHARKDDRWKDMQRRIEAAQKAEDGERD